MVNNVSPLRQSQLFSVADIIPLPLLQGRVLEVDDTFFNTLCTEPNQWRQLMLSNLTIRPCKGVARTLLDRKSRETLRCRMHNMCSVPPEEVQLHGCACTDTLHCHRLFFGTYNNTTNRYVGRYRFVQDGYARQKKLIKVVKSLCRMCLVCVLHHRALHGAQ
jgi:hypothetical protein